MRAPPTPIPKAVAWDRLGLVFYRRGRRTAKPSPATLRWFLHGLRPAQPILIVGGTSVGMIRAAAAAGLETWVMDFSARICRELPRFVGSDVHIVGADVLQPPVELLAGFDVVLADTLVNRFEHAEAKRFEVACYRLLVPAGELRTTVKLGLYPMDERMIGLGRQRGCLDRFWDERTSTIDFAAAGDVLDRALARHGGISRRSLLDWYRGRGRESRYGVDDLERLFPTERWPDIEITSDSPSPDRVRLSARRGPTR